MSDVTADREGREWYHQTKFIADILKENGKTKPVSEGRKWYHKTKFITDVLKENARTKLVDEGHKQYHKTKLIAIHKDDFDEDDGDDDDESPCQEEVTEIYSCLASEGMTVAEQEACGNCLNEASEKEKNDNVRCYEMEEKGFCDDVATCANDVCGNDCSDEVHAAVSCMTNATWCGGYDSECLGGDELPCHDEMNDFTECEDSNEESIEEVDACLTCLYDAFDVLIENEATCSELEESGYCDAVQSCANGDCNNDCSDELHVLEACRIDNAGCDDAYDSECLTGM